MNALIIGGTGFIGYHCCKILSDAGFNVIAYSPSAGSISIDKNIIGVAGFLENKEEVLKWVSWSDIVFHFAGTILPHKNVINLKKEFETNLTSLISLLEILKITPVKKIIFCSTGGAIYGNLKSKPFSETDQTTPLNHYGYIKSLMEEKIIEYHKLNGIQFMILRPSNVFGPKLKAIGKQGIISTLLFNGLHDTKTEIWDSPANIRDFIFIEDFGRALMALLQSNAEGIFNIGSGNGHSIIEIIEKVQTHIKNKLKIEFISANEEKPTKNILDISKIKDITGWTPEVSLERGIEITFNSLIETSSLKGKGAV